jgi:hypothetical protein
MPSFEQAIPKDFKDVASPHALLELLAHRSYNSTLFNRSVTRLGIGRVHFREAIASGTITKLVSRSYPFLQQAAANHREGQLLLLLDEPWRGKRRPALQRWCRGSDSSQINFAGRSFTWC